MSITDLTGFATPGSPGASPSSGTSAPPMINRATVVRAPASYADGMDISLQGVGQAFPFEIPAGHWDIRGALPASGALCLVIFDDRGDVWVPLVYSTAAPAGGGGDGGGNIDGGFPDSVYGGTPLIDGGPI